MPDEPKQGEEKPSLDAGANGNGNGNAAARPAAGEARPVITENERINDLLLGIIEREIGRGEPRRPEDWATLRELASGQPRNLELVATFQGVIDRCNDEMVNRLAAQGIDLRRLRDSVVMLIRIALAKKALTGSAVKES